MAPPLASRQLTGVVVSAGKMVKTVKVRIAKQEWHKHIRKV
jgi:small subunit ribosomal protein S17